MRRTRAELGPAADDYEDAVLRLAGRFRPDRRRAASAGSAGRGRGRGAAGARRGGGAGVGKERGIPASGEDKVWGGRGREWDGGDSDAWDGQQGMDAVDDMVGPDGLLYP